MSDGMPPDVDRLLTVLAERTERGELQWQAVSKDSTSFVHTGKAGSISIASDDGDGNHPYTVGLLTAEGVVGESWTSVDMSHQEPEMAPYLRLLERLYNAARRSSAGSTNLVKDLIQEIVPDDVPF